MNTAPLLKPLTREQINRRLRRIFDPFSLHALHDFADTCSVFQTIENLLDSMTFESSKVPYKIIWGI